VTDTLWRAGATVFSEEERLQLNLGSLEFIACGK